MEYYIVIPVLFILFVCRPIYITSYSLSPLAGTSNFDAAMWLCVGWVAGAPLAWMLGGREFPTNTQPTGFKLAKALVLDFCVDFSNNLDDIMGGGGLNVEPIPVSGWDPCQAR